MPIAFLKPLHRTFTNIPLRWVLVFPFVLQIVGAVALVGYLSNRAGQLAVTDLAQQLMQEKGDRIVQHLSHHFEAPKQLTKEHQAVIDLGILDWQENSLIKTYFVRQLRLYQQVSGVMITTENNEVLAVSRFQVNQLSIGERNPVTGSLDNYVTDLQGKRLYLQDPIPNFDPGRISPEQLWNGEAKAARDGIWRLVVSMAQGQKQPSLMMAYFLAFKDPQGIVRGVLGSNTDLNQTGIFLRDLKIGKTGQALIVDDKGRLIATSTNERPVRLEAAIADGRSQERRSLQVGAQDSQDPVTRAAAAWSRTQMLSSKENAQLSGFRLQNEQYFGQVIPFQLDNQIQWTIILVMPESDFMAEIQVNNAKTIFLCWLTLLATTAMGLLTARWVTRPILKLNQASEALALGAWQPALSENTPIAELKSLTGSFNQTAAQLQQSFEQIKTALDESEEKFTKVFRNCPDPIALATLADGRCVEANDSFLAVLEYAREEVIGQRFLDLGIWGDLSDRAKLRDALNQYGYVRNLEVRACTGSGQIKTLLISSELIEISGVTYSLGIGKDISDRKLAEAALFESEQRFREIAKTIPQLFFVRSLDPPQYLYISPAYEKIWGRPRQELIQNPLIWMEAIHPDDRSQVEASFAAQLAGHDVQREYRIVRPDGAVRWIAATVSIIRDEAGNPIRFVGLAEDISDRKQAEAALQQSEAALREAQRVAHVGSWEFDLETQVLIWSEELYRIHHRDPQGAPPSLEEITTQIVYSEDMPLYQAFIEQLAQGNSAEQDFRIVAQDGTIRYVESRGEAIVDASGQIIRLVGTTLDISDRKQTEDQLRKTQQWLQQFSRQSPSNIYTLVQEPDGRLWFEYLSTAVEAIHELTMEQVLQDASLLILSIHPDDQAGYENAVLASMQDLSPFSYQWRIITPSGRLKWVQANSQPERRQNGAIAWHGFVQEITERKQAEADLRESEERFRLAFDNAAIGMTIVALDGTFLKVNRSFCEMVGYSEAELLQENFQALTHPDDLDRDLDHVQQLLNSESRSFQMEKRYVHKQGYVIWVILSASLIRNQNQQPLYFVSQIQDISDRHSAERVKEEFISVVSHELRTPLTSIRGSLGILATGALDQKPEIAKRMLKVAVSNSERLVRLVNDILDLERLESGNVEMVLEDCDVKELIKQARESVQSLANESFVTLKITSIAAKIQANEAAIVQVLTNLLGNAIKFSTEGSVVWLKAELLDLQNWAGAEAIAPAALATAAPAQPDSTAVILFSIKDQGRGIPPENLETIFGRFQQVDASDARQKGGTGLGLAICKSIVRQHHGQIWAESVINQSSTFYFTIPLSVEP